LGFVEPYRKSAVNIAVNIVDQRANLYRGRFARAGYVSKNFHSHVSIVKFSLKNFACRH
jgi:hypothetical protein